MKAVLLLLAYAASVIGWAWIAFAMDDHWRQARADAPPSRPTILALRAVGSAALAAALLLCLRADHASMAALVWLMTLTAAALSVALLLASRPRWLAPLVAWVRPSPLTDGTGSRRA